MITEFKVNDYISLKLEKQETVIYVSQDRFIQCIYLLVDVPIDEKQEFSEIESVDEQAKMLDVSAEFVKNKKISPENEFWAHCSNLQFWHEEGYDTRYLHRNLAFPLLKRLAEAGDPRAKKMFKEEIAKRIESGAITVIIYLFKEGYIDILNEEEQDVLLLDSNKKFIDNLERFIDDLFELKNINLIKGAVNGLNRLSTSGVSHIKIKLMDKIKERILNCNDVEIFEFLERFDFGLIGKEIFRNLFLGLDSAFNNKLRVFLDSKNENDVENGIYLLSILIDKGDISLKNQIKKILTKKLDRVSIKKINHYLSCGFLKHFEKNELETILFSSRSTLKKRLMERIDEEMKQFLTNHLQDSTFYKDPTITLLNRLAELDVFNAKKLINFYSSKIIKSGHRRSISYFLSRGYMNFFDKGTSKTLFLQNRQIFLENMKLLRKLADLGDIEERKEYKNAILLKLRYGTYKEFLNVMKYHFDYLTENEQEAFLSKPGKKFIERVEKEFGECDIDKDKEWKYDWIELIEKMKQIKKKD